MELDYVEIRGGKPLYGTVSVQGSKNAVLPMLAAAILHEGVSRIRYCPRIQDVEDSIALLRALGCQVWWEGNCLAVDASEVKEWRIPGQLGCGMRSSILFLGALLGRMGKAKLPYPGGCVLGARPVDLHLMGMRMLGARIEEKEDCVEAYTQGLRGAGIRLRFPSVGATENIILAAVLASGETIIENAAREPEIEELCSFLREKGARIERKPDGTVIVTGVACLKDNCHELAADRIAAGTYLLAAAVTGGRITVERMPFDQMEKVNDVLEQSGVVLHRQGDSLVADGSKGIHGLELLETAPYPGFPTDLQSPMMTLLSVAEGVSRIRENIFEARFKTAQELCRMGADIRTEGREAVIRGIPRLHGAKVEAFELRGAAALFLAGLNAAGTTRIRGCRYIQRGYEDICGVLAGLGAQIVSGEEI